MPRGGLIRQEVGFQAAVGRGRQDTAGLCATGIRRLPEMRSAGTWVVCYRLSTIFQILHLKQPSFAVITRFMISS